MDGGLDEAAMAALREHLGPQHRGKMLFQMGPNGMAQPLGIAGGVPGAEAEGPEPELKLGDPAVVHSLKAAEHNGTQVLLREWNPERGRWIVETVMEGKKLKIRPANLRRARMQASDLPPIPLSALRKAMQEHHEAKWPAPEPEPEPEPEPMRKKVIKPRRKAPRPQADEPEPPPEERQCRICLDGGELIAPCDCRGTSRYVHADCIAKWRASQRERPGGRSLATRCDVCGAQYRGLPPPPTPPCLVRARNWGLELFTTYESLGAFLLRDNTTMFVVVLAVAWCAFVRTISSLQTLSGLVVFVQVQAAPHRAVPVPLRLPARHAHPARVQPHALRHHDPRLAHHPARRARGRPGAGRRAGIPRPKRRDQPLPQDCSLPCRA